MKDLIVIALSAGGGAVAALLVMRVRRSILKQLNELVATLPDPASPRSKDAGPRRLSFGYFLRRASFNWRWTSAFDSQGLRWK
jgi:hypothetical protein